MTTPPSQERDTILSLEPSAAFSFGQMLQALIQVYRVQPAEIAKLKARIKKIQREGIPMGTNVGKGPRVRYSLDQFFQLIVVLELAELSISLTTASEFVRYYWPKGVVSMAPARAWTMHLNPEGSDPDSVLILASASETEGFSRVYTGEETEDPQETRMPRSTRAGDRLSMVTLSEVTTGNRLQIGKKSGLTPRWRASVIDCSTLVLIVVEALEHLGLVSQDDFTVWAQRQSEAVKIDPVY